MSADRLMWSFAKTDSLGEARPRRGHVMFGRSINRIQWTVMGLHSCLCNASWTLVFIFTDLCFIERGMTENFSWCRCWSWVTPEEAWLFLLGRATSAGLCLLSWHYWTGLLVCSWRICKWIELQLLIPVNWTADFLTTHIKSRFWKKAKLQEATATATLGLLPNCWDPNSSPHVYTASTLPLVGPLSN